MPGVERETRAGQWSTVEEDGLLPRERWRREEKPGQAGRRRQEVLDAGLEVVYCAHSERLAADARRESCWWPAERPPAN
jgi:hypothetical protein